MMRVRVLIRMRSLRQHLPAGHAFVCQDTDQLPVIMRNILQAAL